MMIKNNKSFIPSGDGFGMPNLNHNIVDKEKGYTINVDYVNFKRKIRLPIGECKTTNKNYKTTLYLTYEGLLRLMLSL